MCGAAVGVDSGLGVTLRGLNSPWRGRGQHSKRDRTLKARTPEDCPACRLEQGLAVLDSQGIARAWSEVKSRRGRPEEHDTDGQACMEPSCADYKDTDGTHHAHRWEGPRHR